MIGALCAKLFVKMWIDLICHKYEDDNGKANRLYRPPLPTQMYVLPIYSRLTGGPTETLVCAVETYQMTKNIKMCEQSLHLF